MPRRRPCARSRWKRSRLHRNELSRGVEIPKPPFLGPRLIEAVPVQALLPFLNENMLYQFHWGFKKDGRTLPEFLAWAARS